MDQFRTAIATATTAACLVLTTQIASGQSSPPGNLGLRIPIERNAVRPDLAPMTPYVTQMPLQVPRLGGEIPGATGWPLAANRAPARSLADPVVAADSIGFYNDAGQTLSFQFVAGGASQKIELAARQIVTIQADAGGGDFKAIVGTGATDFQTTLSRGRIYVLRADGAKWVLAAF